MEEEIFSAMAARSTYKEEADAGDGKSSTLGTTIPGIAVPEALRGDGPPPATFPSRFVRPPSSMVGQSSNQAAAWHDQDPSTVHPAVAAASSSVASIGDNSVDGGWCTPKPRFQQSPLQIRSNIDDNSAGSGWRTPKPRPHQLPLRIRSKVDNDNTKNGWRSTKFHPYRSCPQIDVKADDDGGKSGFRTPASLESLVKDSVATKATTKWDDQMLVDPDAETDDESTIDVVQKQSVDIVNVNDGHYWYCQYRKLGSYLDDMNKAFDKMDAEIEYWDNKVEAARRGDYASDSEDEKI